VTVKIRTVRKNAIIFLGGEMAIQIKKTYRGLNPEMLCDEVRGLLEKQGIVVVETESQTYGLPSGATQSRTTLALKMPAKQEEEQKECGSVHIIGSPQDEAKMLLDADETLLSQEKVSAFQEDLDFILGSYEIKW
jgi:hypothetical protein